MLVDVANDCILDDSNSQITTDDNYVTCHIESKLAMYAILGCQRSDEQADHKQEL